MKDKKKLITRINKRKRNEVNYAESTDDSDVEADPQNRKNEPIKEPTFSKPLKDKSSFSNSSDDEFKIDEINNNQQFNLLDNFDLVLKSSDDEHNINDSNIIQQPKLLNNIDSEILESSDDEKDSENQNLLKIDKKNIFVETKEMLQYRKGNIIYFLTSIGEPCDNGAKGLITTNKIPEKQQLKVESDNEIKRSNNKNFFALCIRGKNTSEK